LFQGDHNSEFFHRVANGRKRKQTIFSMMDGDNTIEGDVNLLKHATEYNKKLFRPQFGNAYELDGDLLSHME
jgi:hypothetical protein